AAAGAAGIANARATARKRAWVIAASPGIGRASAEQGSTLIRRPGDEVSVRRTVVPGLCRLCEALHITPFDAGGRISPVAARVWPRRRSAMISARIEIA